MNILITKKNNSLVMPESINFTELVRNSSTTLTLSSQSNMIDLLNKEFTKEESQWYIANLYIYLNYHPTDDYPINLENVYKMLGFANKGNAMKTIKSNFVENDDYKIIKFTKDLYEEKAACPDGKAASASKNLGGAGLNREEIMLNVDTFKNLAMIVKTPKGTEIRKYYIKMENIHNKVIKMEINNTSKLLKEKEQQLEEKEQQLEEKDTLLQRYENRPELDGFFRFLGYIYLIKDITKSGHYKVGFADKPDKRLSQLNTGSSTYSLQLVARFKTFDKIFAEKIIHYALRPFKISKVKEWFYLSNDLELAYTLKTIKDCINYIERYNIESNESFKEINKNFDIKKELEEINNEINLQEQVIIDKKFIQNQTCTHQGQQLTNKTGNYKGVFWKEDKKKWTANLKRNYKNVFLGYHNSELEGAKAYNDYALYLNQNENTKYLLNKIPDYQTKPRDIPNETKKEIIVEAKSSDFNGVSYWKQRKYYVVSIKLNSKTYNLGHNESEIECAKLYNQQALYFNETLNTNYQLNDLGPNYVTVSKNIVKEIVESKLASKSSKYNGVTVVVNKNKEVKFRSVLVYNKKQLHIGFFDDELEAAKAYNKKAEELNTEFKKKYKLNLITS